MALIKLRELAEGFLKKHKSDVNKIKERIISVGKESGINIACTLLSSKLGVSSEKCRPVARIVVNTLTREIRERLTK